MGSPGTCTGEHDAQVHVPEDHLQLGVARPAERFREIGSMPRGIPIRVDARCAKVGRARVVDHVTERVQQPVETTWRSHRTERVRRPVDPCARTARLRAPGSRARLRRRPQALSAACRRTGRRRPSRRGPRPGTSCGAYRVGRRRPSVSPRLPSEPRLRQLGLLPRAPPSGFGHCANRRAGLRLSARERHERSRR